MYQEEDDSTFTHDGRNYHLNTILKLTNKQPPRIFKIQDLEWILRNDVIDLTRVMAAKPDNAPILVAQWNGKFVVVDGLHRLAKAKLMKRDSIEGRLVSDATLDVALLDK